MSDTSLLSVQELLGATLPALVSLGGTPAMVAAPISAVAGGRKKASNNPWFPFHYQRLEYIRNPRAKFPITEHNFVWDVRKGQRNYTVEESLYRYTFNFELLTIDQWLERSKDRVNLTDACMDHVVAVLKKWCALGNEANLMTMSKNNMLSGTGDNDLITGAKGFDYRQGAIIEVNAGATPVAHLYKDGEWKSFATGWNETPFSKSNKEWEVWF